MAEDNSAPIAPIPSTGVERAGFLVLLILITAGLVLVVWPFAAPLLWAVLAAIIFQPLYQRVLSHMPHYPNRAAMLSLLVITISVVIPAIIIGSLVVEEAAALIVAFQEGRIDLAAIFLQLHDSLPVQMRDALDNSGWGNIAALRERAEEFVTASAGVIVQRALAIGGGVFGLVLGFGVGLYVTYFLLRDGTRLGAAMLRGLPVQTPIAVALGERFLAIVRATIKGSVVVGLVQGALGGITFWIAGVPSAILFALLMAIFSLLPALGPAIVWLPVAVYLLATGFIWQGVVVIVSGVAVIGMADNLLRPILVGRDTGIPDWVILVTTLGGIATIGLSGIVLGPLLAGLAIAGWTILRDQREGVADLPLENDDAAEPAAQI
ncbi:UPF0118 membrane protein [Alteripontixanthobacter maritimus]|uniref:UPF0118 membrane protein n=1 Tax=Alteripontixanthobacter maritimus TaxID=2161824 RepID=A0A369Q276_9SPHN|nr:AI-2E family transporter [Alteripontixanthobacter maritimus]RDC59003.1 UPF0118 membrane protein [Alteripontixanthobacter maritimus]